MSGDLMHKGMTELLPVVPGTLELTDIIPVYQKRTLSVNKITVEQLMNELIRLSGGLGLADAPELAEAKEEAAKEETPATEKPKARTRKPRAKKEDK